MKQTYKRPKPNQDIRDAIKKSPVFTYEVAEALGISANTFLLHLRYNLSPEERGNIMAAIARLSKKVEGSAHE